MCFSLSHLSRDLPSPHSHLFCTYLIFAQQIIIIGPCFMGNVIFVVDFLRIIFGCSQFFLVLSIVMYLLLLNINGLSKSVKTQLFPIIKRLSGPPPSPQTPVRHFPCYLCFENYLAPMFFCNSNMTLTER